MLDFKKDKILYSEVQNFRQSWLWVLLIFSAVTSMLLPAVLIVKDVKTGKEGIWVIAGVTVLQVINLFFFYITMFETVVTDKGIYYRWWPFFRKFRFLSAKEIATVKYEKWTYTHWGYSKTTKFGRGHTVEDDKGVLIQMKDGKKYYIGSQQALTLQTTCEQMINNPLKFA